MCGVWSLASGVRGTDMPEFWFGFAMGACISAVLVLVVAQWILHGVIRDLKRTNQDLDPRSKTQDASGKGPK